jgi:hypothetical protein
MPNIKLSKLNYSTDLPHFKRVCIDPVHAGHIAESIRLGHDIPPILVDRQTDEVVDGFHTARAYEEACGPDTQVPVTYKTFKSLQEKVYTFAYRNRSTKRPLTAPEKLSVVIMYDERGWDSNEAADAVGWTIEKAHSRFKEKVARERGTGKLIPTKTATEHRAGEAWNRSEQAASKKMYDPALNHSRQLICSLENGFTNLECEEVVASLVHLRDLLVGLELPGFYFLRYRLRQDRI